MFYISLFYSIKNIYYNYLKDFLLTIFKFHRPTKFKNNIFFTLRFFFLMFKFSLIIKLKYLFSLTKRNSN